jgi:acetyl-CoA C-acetyltransferase
MIKDTDAVIVSAARTPLGSFGGSLSKLGATDLGGLIIEEAVKRASLEKKDIQEVIMGIVLPCGYGQNPGRQAAIKAGIPMESGGLSINKVCGSGLMSVVLASELIQSGYTEIAAAGGMENMSVAPYYFPKARWGSRMGDAQLVDHMVHDGLWDVVNDFHMGITNDLISEKWSVSRQDQDAFALKSYEKALRSIAEGRFNKEIMPVIIKGRKADIVFDTDECPKATSLEILSAMKPAFQKNGYATAGNSSVISDGASALIIMSYRAAKDRGITPLVKIRASGSSGIELKYVLMAPINSIPKVAKKAGVTIKDIDIHEINEAFAGSSVGIIRELYLDEEKVNVNGGSVALGHPIGASGARVLTTLIYEMKRKKAELGEVSLCLGGAEAVTMIVENI